MAYCNSDNNSSLSTKQGIGSVALAAIETDSEQMPGPEMNVSDLVRNVAYRDPHFDVTDGLTYIADKAAKTEAQGWPVCMRLGSLAVRVLKETAELWSYDCGGRRQLIPGRGEVRNRRQSNPGQWERDGIGPASMAKHRRSCKEVRASTVSSRGFG
jgi:hypothetical protein